MMIVDGMNPDGTKWGIKCMKPKPDDQAGPSCRPGEKLFTSARYVPKGWRSRKVTSGKQTVWCAKPGLLIPAKPICKGGKLVMLKTLPPRWKCICPANTLLKGGKCVPKPVICPKGWKKVNGKCIPPKVQVTPTPKVCPKGWRRVNRNCIPPKIQVTPKPKACPKGWRRVNGKCIPPQIQLKPKSVLKPNPKIKRLPKAVYTPKKNTGKVMMLSPPAKLKSLGPSRQFR